MKVSKERMLVFAMVVLVGILTVIVILASLMMPIARTMSAIRYYEFYGTTAANSSYEQMMEAILTEEEFAEEFVGE